MDGVERLRIANAPLPEDETSEMAAFAITQMMGAPSISASGVLVDVAGACQSPIEHAMFFALLCANAQMTVGQRTLLYREWADRRGYFRLEDHAWCDGRGLADGEQIERYTPDVLSLRLQAPISSYSADLLLEFRGSCGRQDGSEADILVRAVIECDGHDYHERTKEQAAHDRARDREMQRLGYLVLRFTGSEIWRDPIGCALVALQTVDQAQHAQRSEAFGLPQGKPGPVGWEFFRAHREAAE
jgi:hypothetical protein